MRGPRDARLPSRWVLCLICAVTSDSPTGVCSCLGFWNSWNFEDRSTNLRCSVPIGMIGDTSGIRPLGRERRCKCAQYSVVGTNQEL
jgi:hypothetical protein